MMMPQRPDPTLIRLCCDGEATPEQSAQLREYMAANDECRCEIESQIEGERKLREHIRHLMSECPCAPPELRECICRIANEAPQSESVGRITNEAAGRRGHRQSAIRGFFANTQSANWIAVAATLMLIAGAVLFGIFGRTIDDVRPQPEADLVSEAASYADEEHRNSASKLNYQASSPIPTTIQTTPESAERFLSQWLDGPVPVFDLSEMGYRFVLAEPANMPVPARSGHLLYQKYAEPGEKAPMLSVFVIPATGKCRGHLCENQKCGTWSCVTERATKCKKRVLRGTDGRFVYFLVCCDDRAIDSLSRSIKIASTQPISP